MVREEDFLVIIFNMSHYIAVFKNEVDVENEHIRLKIVEVVLMCLCVC